MEEYIRVKDGYLEVKVPIGKGRPSASGKTNVVYTTGGFVSVADSNVKVNITATTPR